ncbi:MAG: decarboxylase, partial [Christensenellaceae bacterium]|nr:decarboxylase [Christensenellaceae bacterium]
MRENRPFDDPILNMLEAFTGPSGRFCMPGHKGFAAQMGLEWSWDITELSGTDNLLAPDGCIARSQELCARENGAAAALYGVNGSSGCILAAF